jgi:hypothetical protein
VLGSLSGSKGTERRLIGLADGNNNQRRGERLAEPLPFDAGVLAVGKLIVGHAKRLMDRGGYKQLLGLLKNPGLMQRINRRPADRWKH